MEREFLKGLELSDDAIDKIMAEYGKNVEKLKAAQETAKAEIEGLKTQVAEANAQIEEFNGLDVEAIKAKSEEWKTKYEQAQADAEKKLEQVQFDHALDSALSGAKARNAKAVKALLDMEGLKLNNGEIIGLDKQLETLKADNGYLFEGEEDAPHFAAQTDGLKASGLDAARAIMGLPPEK